MSHESMQAITDPLFKNKMPLFDGTVAPTGLSKPQTLSGFLGKQPLQYNGTYFSYEPRGKEGAGFAPPWSNSKTSPLDGRSPVSHLSGMEGKNNMMYGQDSISSEESHSHSSSVRRTPVQQGFMVYTRSPEISSPTVAAPVTIRKQKTGAENSSSPSQSSVYVAIPKPVYGLNPCCNELGCVIGQRYSLEHVSPRMPNAIYEHDWMQRAAHYEEKAPIQRNEVLLQQRGLHYECGAERMKRMTAEVYSPSGARTLPSVIEPNYSSYPCTPTRALYGSLSEHSQALQASPRGYPGLYASRPTYEQMTSEVYQERSPMSKYGQLAQHPVFYYSQANGEVESRTQCKDSGSKPGEDVPLLHKHAISNPREHYRVPPWLHAEIPLSCTEMLPNHSFVQGFDYPCYPVPRFNLNTSHIRPPITRQHSSPTFHPAHINASKSSQHIHASATNGKPNTSLHFEQLHGSSPFRHVEKSNPARQMNQPALSPSSMQIGRFFHPLTSLHMDKPAPLAAAVNVDRLRDYSPCETKVKHPKSLPISPAAWKPQSPSRSSDQIPTVVPNAANVRKMIHSPGITKHIAFTPSAGAAVSKKCLKRSISHSSPPLSIKVEDEDLYEVELASKKQKLEKDNGKEGTKTDSPPMPVIDTVFSLAPCQLRLQASGVLCPSKVSQRAVPTSEVHEDKLKQPGKEQMADPDSQQPVVCLTSKKISLDTSAQKKDAEVLEVKTIKVEKVDPSAEDNPVDTRSDCSKAVMKKEPEETRSCNSGPGLKEKRDSDELENKPSFAGENQTPAESKPAEINSSNQVDTQHQPAETLPPKCNPPLQSSQSKVSFKNIPPHCLKLSTYNIIIPEGKQCRAAPPAEKQSPQPMVTLALQLEPLTPVRKHFFELHHSLCKLVSKHVLASSEQDLKNWLSQMETNESKPQSNKVQKVSCLLGVKARELWINEEMKLALGNVHKRLREYTTQERCPFPHVMRTGAVFLPMLVVKELLFPMVQGSYIDQVLQEHRVELRPTTLSEEKILIQLHKRACSSRLRRLMCLKHLPAIYSDVVNLLYYTCVCKHLGLNVDSDSGEGVGGFEASDLRRNPLFSDSASPSESYHQKDWEAKSDLSSRGTKSSLRHTFPDDTCSDEEEAGDVEKINTEGLPRTFTRSNCDAYETENKGSDHMDSSDASQISENSWVCPLTLDDLSPSVSDTEAENSSNLLSGNQPIRPQGESRNCSGMILKLRKMFNKGLNRKKACYQAVSVPGTLADSSQAGEEEGASSKRDLSRTSKIKHRLQRKGNFSHAVGPLSGPSKKVRSLLKIKYCPYLSACHSTEYRKRWVLRSAVQRARRAMRLYYPDLVGKKIRHLYEEDDKSEVWYKGEVLRIHEAHTNPLKTIFEVRYDSEPEWKYYLELLIDYEKGWLKIED